MADTVDPIRLPATTEAGRSPAPAPSTPTSPPTPPAGADDTKVMSLVDHLTELRDRVFKSVLAVALGGVLGFYVSDQVIRILSGALPEGIGPLTTFGIGEAFGIRLRIAAIIGIILAMPVLLYQLWAFISPGLTANERKAVRPWIPLALAFFALGVAVAWIVLPFAAQFLVGFVTEDMDFLPSAREYLDFVSTLFLAFGLILQFPILLYGLSGAGILSSQVLRRSRRVVILGIALFAAIATPGGDPFSFSILGGVMFALFEGTLYFIRRSGR
jgi:sec-independent protein translocase protein TatC